MVNFFLSALSGVLLSFAFEPVGKWYLAPFALAVHMYAFDRSEKKILSVAAFATAFNLVLLHWTSIYVGSTPWLILVVGLSLLYFPMLFISRWGIASYPFLFVVSEEIRNRFPFGGFGWGRVAYSQADAPYANIAFYGGATALSAITVLIGLFLFTLSRKQFNARPLVPLFLLFIPITVPQLSQTNVLMIQGDVPQYGLDFNSRATEVFFNHVEETDKALAQQRNVDFILWPENAVDVDPFSNQNVKATLNKYKIPLIIGAIVDNNNKTFNTSILWTKNGFEVYEKQHLTPFGEYIPLRTLARKVSPLVDQVSDFSEGNTTKTFVIGKARIAPVICYELIDDSILEKAAKGSNILAVQTNSATFGRSPESAQQLSITRIRAIEHARNIVSVSTTGYSAAIDYTGKVVKKSSMGSAEHIYATMGLIQIQSVRDHLGDWALIVTLMWLLLVTRPAYVIRR